MTESVAVDSLRGRAGSNRLVAGLAAVLAVILLLVYSNHFDNPFHFDDFHTIVSNPHIADIANVPRFFADAETQSVLPTNQSYRPMVATLNAFDYWLGGGRDPVVFHVHIFVEFLVTAGLLYLVFGGLWRAATGHSHPLWSLFACAFFAFHTATAETVNYIIARSDGFSTLMVLAGLLIYTRTSGWRRQLGLLPFVVGCLAKPTTLMLAPLLLVWDALLERPGLSVAPERRGALLAVLARSSARTAPYFVVGVAMYAFTRSMFSDTWTPGGASVIDYLRTQPFVMWVYVKTFVLPTGLTADTDLGLVRSWFDIRLLFGVAVVAAMLFCAWLAARQRVTLPITVGILWFFIALIPSSSVIPLAEVMNHHRTYFPYIGLVMAATWALKLAFDRFAGAEPSMRACALAGSAAAVFLGLHAYGTHQRNEIWGSDRSLWYDVTIKSPANGRGLMNYGLSEMSVGDLDSAIDYFERALDSAYGRHPLLQVNLGLAHTALARRSGDAETLQRAESYLRRGLSPMFPRTYYFYARWLHDNGRSDEALAHARTAARLSPANGAAEALLASIEAKVNSDVARLEETTAALGTPEAYLQLSLKYYRLGLYARCIEASEAALTLRPDYAAAYNNICSAHNNLGDYEAAIAACEQALRLNPDFERARGNLDWALSRTGGG